MAFQFWANLLTVKYFSLGYYDWDLDLAAQTMWNLCHGSAFVSLYGTNFLANHSEYFAFILVPVYFFFQHPLTLVYLNLLSFFTGAFILYRIAQENIGSKAAILFMALFIIYPANIFMLLYEFHFESLAVIFVFLIYYFYQKEKFIPFMIAAFLMCSLKENMPMIIAMFGIYALFNKKDKKMLWSLSPLLLGVGIFALEMFVLTPYWRRDLLSTNNIYWGAYAQLGNSPLSIIRSFFLHPAQVASIVFDQMNGRYIRELFGPFLTLAFLSPHILFLGLPVFAQNLLSNSSGQHSIFFHYTAVLVPFIFLASVHTWKIVQKNFRPFTTALLALLIIFTAILHIDNFRRPLSDRLSFLAPDRLNSVRWKMIDQIPPEAGVVTTFSLMDPLNQRRDLYALYNVWLDANYFTSRSPFQVPEQIAYALIDFDDPWLNAALANDPLVVSERIRRLLGPAWSVQSAVEDVILFRKDIENSSQLIEINKENSPEGIDLSIDGQIILSSLEIDQNLASGSKILPITFYWKAAKNNVDGYLATLVLTKDEKIIYKKTRRVGYAILPTEVWKENDRVKENYTYLLPSLERGEYGIQLALFDLTKNIPAKLKFANDPQTYKSVAIGKLNVR